MRFDSSRSVPSTARRAMLGAAIGCGGLALLPPARGELLHGGVNTRIKGQPVWRDMDQADLDAAYDQSKYAPNQPQLLKRYSTNSEVARTRLGSPRRIAYGPTAIEALDIYQTDQPGAPINVFLHGGAWRNGLAKDYAFAAEMFVGAGAHLIIPDFAWVQDADGSLMTMTDQVRRAIAWVYRNASTFNGNPDRLYVSGHSSGAHLAGVLLTTDWQKEFGLRPDILKGAVCCSGLFDLKAPRLSARSSYVKFTDEVEELLSPQRHIARLNAPLIVAYGSLETPEFQRQSRDFASAVKAAGKPVTVVVGEGYNHFEIIETLANPYGLLGRAALDQMQLSPR